MFRESNYRFWDRASLNIHMNDENWSLFVNEYAIFVVCINDTGQ